MFKKDYLKEAERIDREIEKIVSKIEKNKLKTRNVKKMKSLSKVEKELLFKIARILESYCKEEDDNCILYIRAALLKYRPIDIVKLIENALSENKSILIELKKIVDEKDLEKVKNIHGFRIFSKFFKKTSREDLR